MCVEFAFPGPTWPLLLLPLRSILEDKMALSLTGVLGDSFWKLAAFSCQRLGEQDKMEEERAPSSCSLPNKAEKVELKIRQSFPLMHEVRPQQARA